MPKHVPIGVGKEILTVSRFLNSKSEISSINLDFSLKHYTKNCQWI